jgi:hypothetical protein
MNIEWQFGGLMDLSAYHFTAMKTEIGSDFICGQVTRKWFLDSDSVALRSSLYKLK